jgi:hypothetical protein
VGGRGIFFLQRPTSFSRAGGHYSKSSAACVCRRPLAVVVERKGESFRVTRVRQEGRFFAVHMRHACESRGRREAHMIDIYAEYGRWCYYFLSYLPQVQWLEMRAWS